MEETLRAASGNASPSAPGRREPVPAGTIAQDPTRPAGSVARCLDALRVVTNPGLPVRLRVRTSAMLVSHIDKAFAHAPDDPRLRQVAADYDATLHEQLLPALAQHGNEIVDWSGLNRFERLRVIDTFEQLWHPLLTPMAFDPAHPFPRVPGLAVSLALRVRDPSTCRTRFVCITLPPRRPRFVAVHAGRVVSTESLVAALVPRLVAGVEVLECSCFRVTRSNGTVVRLEIEQRTTTDTAELLGLRFAVPQSRVDRLRSPLAMGAPVAELPVDGLP